MLFRNRVISLIFVLTFAGGIFCSLSSANDILNEKELIWLKKNNGKIRLAPDPNAPPLDFFDEDGKYKGLTADYVRLIEKKLGCQFEIVRMESWDAVLKAAYEKKVDIRIGSCFLSRKVLEVIEKKIKPEVWPPAGASMSKRS